MDAGTRADVHHVIGSTDGVFIVFHHHQGVSKIPEPHQGVQETVVVPLMQADAWLIQHIEHPGETGTDLGCETDALGFTAGERHRRSIKAQVVETNIKQEFQTQADFPEHQITDLDLTGIQQGL